jgi:glutaredoxin
MARTVIEVKLYTKPDCHLCEAVEQVIREVAKTRRFAFIPVNIEEDAAAYEMYKHEIPVVFVAGREIARHRLNRVEFEHALEQA